MSSWKAAALATLVACGGAPAPVIPATSLPPSSSDPRPAVPTAGATRAPSTPASFTLPADAATVDVRDRGRAPRARLAIAPRVTQEVRVSIAAFPEVDGASSPAPGLDATLRLEPGAVDAAGLTPVTATITAAEIDDAGGLYQPPDWSALEDAAASLVGGTLSGAVARDGRWSDLAVRLPAEHAGAEELVQVLARAFPSALVVPDVEVGPGASWIVTRPSRTLGGVAVTAVTTFRLDDDGALIHGDLEVRGDDQRLPGPGLALRGITGRGSVDLVREDDGFGLRTMGELEVTMTATANGRTAPLRDRIRWLGVPRRAD